LTSRQCFDRGMPRPTDRNRARKDAEARFPIKIDMLKPA
jgi:hypothetical protein